MQACRLARAVSPSARCSRLARPPTPFQRVEAHKLDVRLVTPHPENVILTDFYWQEPRRHRDSACRAAAAIKGPPCGRTATWNGVLLNPQLADRVDENPPVCREDVRIFEARIKIAEGWLVCPWAGPRNELFDERFDLAPSDFAWRDGVANGTQRSPRQIEYPNRDSVGCPYVESVATDGDMGFLSERPWEVIAAVEVAF